MRIIFFGIFLSLFSCGGDENINSSQFILINQISGNGNISLYDYPDNKLTEQYFTINTPVPSRVFDAVKDGQYIFMHTGSPAMPPYKLRKIDIGNGLQVKDGDSWISTLSPVHMDSNQGRVILGYVGYDSDKAIYFSCLKFYDENLVLQDSLTEENARELRAMKVVNNRLFYNVIIEDEGSFIRVMDLSSNTIIDSIEVPLCNQFVYLSGNQLLVIVNTGYFILNTQSLEATETKPPGFGMDAMTFNERDNVLYILRSNAQPASTPYTLGTVDLSTGQFTPLSKTGEWIDGPILYDPNTNVIVSGGGVKVFSTNGELMKNVDLPFMASHIFINEK
jgi:hypothetical protein